jgi:outer membrane receptor for ferrienterochelin and colicins
VLATVAAFAIPSTGRAQTPAPDPATMTIEQLLEVELVSTASKFAQKATQAPASVTVVTAQQIRDFGYRTLADVLSGVRGFYTTYDRNYAYVGVRGFARPGDYNTRVLLLVDGHRLNEPIYDMAPIGTDFPVDVSLIERIEVIRGPGSSLYGTSAFFAVINVITKSAESAPGARVDVALGSLETQRATASVGHVFDSGNEVHLAASGYRSGGNARLYFPEFDVPGISDGVFVNGDDDRSIGLLASSSIGRLRISSAFVDRAKRIPTGSFSSVFGDRRARTVDRRGYADAAYTGPFGGNWTGVARGGLDYYGYAGRYPFESEADGIIVQHDGARAVQASGELTLNRRGRHDVLTLGAELRRSLYNRQFISDLSGSQLDERHPSTALGVYVQDQLTIRPWLLFTAGARLDHDRAFGSSVTPRTGLVFLPGGASTLKVLYGRAFRAPNSYELYYYSTMQGEGLNLGPETIATRDVVWEQNVGANFRVELSAFHYDAGHLVEQRTLSAYDPETGYGLYFANAGRTTAHGADAQLEGCWANGVTASFGYGYVRAADWATRQPLSNSPRHLSSLRLVTPLTALASRVAFEMRGVSERRALDGGTVPGFVIGNVTTTTSINKKLDLELSLYNVTNTRYADPGAEEHLQRSLAQDGRTARVRVIARF